MQVRQLLLTRTRATWYIHIQTLHSDVLGIDEREQDWELRHLDMSRLVALSSVVAARGVALPDISCVIIHPMARETRLHQ